MSSLLKGIPLRRQLLYLLLLGLIPLVLALNFTLKEHQAIVTAQSRLATFYEAAQLAEAREANNKAVHSAYSEVDHRYIDNHLETLRLLDEEIKALEELFRSEDFAVDEQLIKRLHQLRENNKIVFTEGNVLGYSTFQETIETLAETVEVNSDDIQALLARIEGTTFDTHKEGVGRPQLIITRFQINRKKINSQAKSNDSDSEVFVLNIQVLKREYL